MTKKEQKQNRRKKKLFLAILMILFTGVLLSTSTYAWFTANKTVKVDEINVQVAASNGLQISVDGINWKASVNETDILGAKTTYSGAVNQIPSSYSTPVSTAGLVNANGRMLMYKGEVSTNDDGNYTFKASSSAETTGESSGGTSGDFVAFDLFFKVSSSQTLYLISGAGVTLDNASSASGIQNAARVGFVVLGNTPSSSASGTIQALNTGANSPVYIWEPNYDTHTGAAVQAAKTTYGLDTTQTNASQITYYGVKNTISSEIMLSPLAASDTYDNYFGTTHSGSFTKVEPKITTANGTLGSDAYVTAFELTEGVTKVRVYLWVEGQDVDCENDASGGSINYALNFGIKDTNA